MFNHFCHVCIKSIKIFVFGGVIITNTGTQFEFYGNSFVKKVKLKGFFIRQVEIKANRTGPSFFM